MLLTPRTKKREGAAPGSESRVTHPQIQYIRKALACARELIILADEGEAHCQDNGCAVLYGVVRDCAYKIRAEAERERDVHKARGLWDNETLCETEANR